MDKVTYKVARGGTLIDAINRKWAAGGSVRLAMLAANADYNGHHVSVWFNDYRGYWIAEYHWGERVVLGRGTLQQCLDAAMAEFNRGAKFACVAATVSTEADAALCLSAGLRLESEVDAEDARKADPRFGKINEAFDYERLLGLPSVSLLANSKTVAEYEAAVKQEIEARKATRKAVAL